MKKIFLIVITLLPFFAFAQEPQPFTIKSKIGNLNTPARAYLIYQLGANRVIDSAEIINGSFDFTGSVMNPVNAYLVIDRKGVGFSRLDSTADVLSFYIDRGTLSLASADSVSKAKFTGSKINDDNKKLEAQFMPLMKKAKEVRAQALAASPAEQNSAAFQNAMQAKQRELQIEQKAILKMFILSNPDSYLSLLALSSVGGPSPDPTEVDPLYDALSPELKNTETAKVFKKALDGLRATAIGTIAKDFTEPDINGTPVSLSSFKGKYVLVDFWASWCGPCREENPNVVKTYNRYKDKNFTILGVSLDRPDSRSSWLAAIKSDGLAWTQVSDLQFWNNAAAVLYNVSSIPANFLIDPQGKIIARNLRGDDLENKLAEVLANN